MSDLHHMLRVPSPFRRRRAVAALLVAMIAAGCGEGSTEPTTTTIASLTIAPSTGPLERTTTRQLEAVARDASNDVVTGQAVAWTSSAPTIASVGATTGLVTALDRGRATITATSGTKTAMTEVEVIILYRSITAGDAFSCDLGSIGIATCWGYNGGQDGRLGNGPLDNASLADSPMQVAVLGTQRFASISSGSRHSCGLTSAGAAYCWGSNGDGQLGAPTFPSWAHQPVAVSGGLTFTQISAGSSHTCAITAAGAAYCWGDNGVGQLGNNSTTDSDVPVAVSGGIAFAAISASANAGGNSKTCGVATDGRGFCWGSDTNGEIGDGGTISYLTTDIRKVPTQVSGPTNFRSIAAGMFHVCGVLTTGAGYCWGSNNSGKLGINADTDASVPVPLATAQTFAQIEVGYMHSCGVTTSSALYCWGANVSGESGTASDVGQVSKSPVLAAAGEWAEVNLGGTAAHTCMITRDRLSVRCMGRNDSGQLGINATAGVNVPHAAPLLVVGQQPLP